MKCPFRISPTGINIYRKCPRAFYFYTRKYPKLEPPFKEPLLLGTAVHEIIAHYYDIMPDDIVPGDVKIWVRKSMVEKWKPEYEPVRQRIENQLLTFINFEKRRLSWHINPKPVAVEKEYTKNCVHGIVDAIFRKNGEKIIVDWKTGRSTATLTDDIIVQLNVYMWLTGADRAYVLFLEYGNFEELTRSFDVEEVVQEILTDRRYVPIRSDKCKFCQYQIPCLVLDGKISFNKISMWWENVL